MGRLTTLVEPRDRSALALDEIGLAGAESVDLGEPTEDTLLFCVRGSGALELDGESFVLAAGSAALVLAGERARLTAGADGLELIAARVGPSAERHAQLGARAVVVSSHGADEQATGERSYRVLLGPHNGSLRATMFLGTVPPGRAPWHYHPYEEIVWARRLPVRLHRAESVEDVGAGEAFRLRARELHIVENGGEEPLELLGVFTPAGSPAAAYLPPEPVPT